jgi:YD repeat-containing protein
VLFGSKVALRDATRRTRTAIALFDGSLPGAAELLAAGEVAFEHVAALADAKDDLPCSALPGLLDAAKTTAPDRFARKVKRACPPPEKPAPPDAATGITSKGRRWFHLDYENSDGDVVLNTLERFMDQLFKTDHPDRSDTKLQLPPYGERMAEALLELCRRFNNGTLGDGFTRPTVDLIVVVTYDQLFRDATAAGVCTTLDGTPLPVSTVRKLLVDAKVYPVVMGGNGEVLDYGRGKRFFTDTQRRAIAVRDGGTCQFADCDKPVRYTDAHHSVPWAEGGLTNVGDGVPACRQHHKQLTDDGYRIARHDGTTYTYDPQGRLIHKRTNRWRQ